MKMKKMISAATVVAATALLAIPAFAATKTVSVKDNFFSPKALTVGKGTTVKWAWKGHAPHNVTVTKGPVKFRSSYRDSGSFSKKMRHAGRYTIVCTIHSGMKMKLRVTR